jgi:NADH-quinone oxidoreductase subunit C
VVRLSDATSTTDQVPALPGDALREGVLQQLQTALGDGLVDSLIKPGDDIWVRVRTDAWRDAGMALRDIVGCDYFCFLSAIDWMPSPFGRGEDDPTEPPPERDTTIRPGYVGGDTRMQVFARLASTTAHFGVTIKADVDDIEQTIDSWVPVYAGANWHERTTHELFGVRFEGHPDLRNLYLPGDFEGHPLRKDFPLLARLVKPNEDPAPDEEGASE